jgi:hypothetical protein
MTTWRTRLARTALGAAALAALASAGCAGDDPLSSQDNTPPSLSVVQPGAEAVLQTPRPTFLVRVSDSGSGVFVSTINVVIDGRNVSQAFINGYDPVRGEIRVTGLIELADGLHTMVIRVADNAANSSSLTRTFTTLSGGASGGGT